MQISPQNQSLVACRQDVLVLGVFAETWQKGPTAELDHALQGALVKHAKAHSFSGCTKQHFMWPTSGKIACRWVVLVGLGKRCASQEQTWLRLGGAALRLAQSVQAKSVLVVPPAGPVTDAHADFDADTHIDSDFDANADVDFDAEMASGLTRGMVLGAYSYRKFKQDAPKNKAPAKCFLHLPVTAAVQKKIKWSHAVAEGVALARDLVNEPPNLLYPETFAKRAAVLGRSVGLTVRILEPQALKRQGMNLLLAVGAGSVRTPRLVHLSYSGTPAGRKQKPIALVGKGITFDSGGLCVKTCEAMGTMKLDMGGAAAVLATLVTAARLRLPVAVHGILALAENMPSGSAFRCGDVIRSAAGPTVEINNTDAEGRLVLADALHYAQKIAKPGCMIDLATLTGACMIALGPHTMGLFANTDSLAQQLLAAAQNSGEDAWRLPLTAALRPQLHSEVADMRNTGERYGGAITAALFLKEFVGQTPWAHLDIAGPAWTGEDANYTSKGGTGVGVATLVEFLTATGGQARGSN